LPERVTPERTTHPVVFLILFLPMGISNGYVVVTLGYLLTHAGISVSAVAGLVALSLIPQTWKFLWAPVVDTTLTNKIWFLIAAAVTGLLMIGTAIIPQSSANLLPIEAMVVGFSLASTFNMMAADSLMAHATAPEDKGRAGGWSQAGNLGGQGLGGGAGLWLAQHVDAQWVSGTALGLACVFAALAVLWVDEPPSEHRATRYIDSLKNVGKDVWSIVRKRLGFLALLLMCLPIGTGAAQNLWSAVAGDWHASADTVALVNGAMGGAVAMIGCVVGGYICDAMDRKLAFNLFGLLLGVCAVAMAIAPRTEMMFIVFTLVYAFVTGFCYAAFGAVVLEAIGAGAAATKYNVLAGIANAPIAYLTVIDGWAQTKWGAWGMLSADALGPVVGVGVFILIALGTRRLFGRESLAKKASQFRA